MAKILKYELRRLLLNKFFIGLLVINGIFAWYILVSDTIAGVAYTAPFSVWSFSAYLSSVLPMATITLLFLLTFFHSKKEKQVKVLTTATPVDAFRYAMIRNIAVALGFLLILILEIGMSVYFYSALFAFREYTAFIIPALVTIVPCFVFALGAGHLAGRIHPGLLYALMPVAFAMAFARLPGGFDPFGGGYYTSAPLSLPIGADGEPAFVLNAVFIAARALYSAVGIAFFFLGTRRRRRKSELA